ncbi:MAG: purine-nucleoside phosphorylase [Schwartzia sp.]|nr:purine-nucleoside phosphorylase [Schwartzia sp. (in: firmicutes)]
MTWHIAAKKGEIAERVLLPGDPLRAKHIAETFLDDAKEYTHIRNMLGFNGTYKGVPISVQGTGMGMPSMAIYANELIREYGAKVLIRTGTCGALQEDVHVRDVVMAQASTTDSQMGENMFQHSIHFAPVANFALLENAVAAARKLKIKFHVGNVLSQDRLYDEELDLKSLANHGVLAAEMETAALYLIAARLHIKALGIFTVSNHILTGEETTPEERETSFNDMARIALEAAISTSPSAA